MRLALFTDGIEPFVMGGMQRHSFLLAKYMAKLNVAVDLYHPDIPGMNGSFKNLFNGLNVRLITVSVPVRGSLPGHYLREQYAFSTALFHRLMAEERVDFIYAKGFTGWHLLSQKHRFSGLPPVGVNLHGLEMFQESSSIRTRIESFMLGWPARYVLKRADHVFSYGGRITGLLEKIGVKREQISECPSGVEPGTWISTAPPDHRPLRFVFVGRNERRKALPELQEAIGMLAGSGMEFEMHFVGPHPCDKGIPRSVFHGVISDKQKLFSLLGSCDVLICPSYSEGMPNVILEAMSQGLAIIASDTGAVNTMVDRDNGWLLSSPDPGIIRDALQEAIRISPEEMIIKKECSLARVRQEFNWDNIAPRLLRELELRCMRSSAAS